MTKFNFSRSTIIAAAVLGFGSLLVSSFQAQASSATSIYQCRAFTAEKAVRCCDTIVKTQGRPLWMKENHSTCQTAVTCGSGYMKIIASNYPCYINQNYGERELEFKGRGGRQSGKN